MSVGARMLLFWIGSAAAVVIVLLVWGWRNGQFRNIEEAKYRMLEDREPEPWPDRSEEGRSARKRGSCEEGTGR